MPSSLTRKVSSKARVVGDFDGTFVRYETGVEVKIQRFRVVQSAGMEPDSLGMVIPCQWQAVFEERSARTPANQ